MHPRLSLRLGLRTLTLTLMPRRGGISRLLRGAKQPHPRAHVLGFLQVLEHRTAPALSQMAQAEKLGRRHAEHRIAALPLLLRPQRLGLVAEQTRQPVRLRVDGAVHLLDGVSCQLTDILS